MGSNGVHGDFMVFYHAVPGKKEGLNAIFMGMS